MGNILDKLIWFLAGVIGSHVVHFIYQSRYAGRMSGIGVSESLAMIFEDILQAGLYLLDVILPLLVFSPQIILGIAGLITAVILFFIGFKLYIRIKNNSVYTQKIKEAENIMAEARTYAEERLEENKSLKKKLITDFKQREQLLQNDFEKNLDEYRDRIKKLGQERLELRETATELMRRLKAK